MDARYSIREFSNMTGLAPSKIRYYEKLGLFDGHRLSNGYRYYDPEDAFRANAFRSLVLYGFTVEQAIHALDEAQNTESFALTLREKQQELTQLQQLLAAKQAMLDETLHFLHHLPPINDFSVQDREDLLFVYASEGRDFTVSEQNRDAVQRFTALHGFSRFARILPATQLQSGQEILDPCYVSAMPLHELRRLESCPPEQVHTLSLGKCLVFHRALTRAESAQAVSFAPMLQWLEQHGYRLRNDLVIYPSFLNLDGAGRDVETVVVPIS
jgi:DNA-binding transcriptional MerR regulator